MLIDSVPPRNRDIGAAEHDALGAVGDGLQTGRAEAVDGHGRGLDRHSRTQAGDARDVEALFAFRHRAAEDDVVHVGRRDPGARASASRMTIGRHVVGPHRR